MKESERIANLLEKRWQRLEEGERLPTTATLAAEYSTSLATTNQAIKSLVDKKKFRTVVGKGIFVTGKARTDFSDSGLSFLPSSTMLRIFTGSDEEPDKKMWNQLISLFSQKFPYISVGDVGLEGKQIADIILISPGEVCANAYNQQIIDLTPFTQVPEDIDDFFTGSFTSPFSEPGFWWAPVFMHPGILAYNTSIMKKLGIDYLDGNVTFEEFTTHFTEVSRKLGKTQISSAVPGFSSIGYTGAFISEGVDLFTPNLYLKTTDSYCQNFSRVLDLLRQNAGLSTEVLRAIQNGRNIRELFSQGDAAILMDGNFYSSILKMKNIFVRPAINAGRFFSAAGFVVKKQAENPVVAGHFLSFLMNPDAQEIIAGHGKTPIRRTAMKKLRKLPKGLTLQDLSIYLDSVKTITLHHPVQMQMVQNALNLEVLNFLTSTEDARDTGGKIINKCNSYIKHFLDSKKT